MKNLSLVTAKVVRENEMYRYKLVGKGEKYLVAHEDMENPGDKVVVELTPFAKEPVVIEQVVLQKNVEFIESDGDVIYKSAVEYIELNENTGKKVRRNYYLRANSTKEAFDVLSDYISVFVSDNSIVSVVRTKIIDVFLDWGCKDDNDFNGCDDE